MLQAPLISGILFYTIPIILTSVLQLLFNAVDLVIVGRFCGSISVAAVGATGAITNLIVNLFMGLSIGAGVTAMYTLCFRMLRQEEGNIIKPYFRAFKENFKPATGVFAILVFVLVPD